MQSKQDLILKCSVAYLHVGQKDSIFQMGRSWLTPFACLGVLKNVFYIYFFGNYYKIS